MPKPQAPINEVLTLAEAAKYLRLGTRTLYQLSTEGKIPAKKIGHQWRFRKITIDQWLDNGKEVLSSQNSPRNKR